MNAPSRRQLLAERNGGRRMAPTPVYTPPEAVRSGGDPDLQGRAEVDNDGTTVRDAALVVGRGRCGTGTGRRPRRRAHHGGLGVLAEDLAGDRPDHGARRDLLDVLALRLV